MNPITQPLHLQLQQTPTPKQMDTNNEYYQTNNQGNTGHFIPHPEFQMHSNSAIGHPQGPYSTFQPPIYSPRSLPQHFISSHTNSNTPPNYYQPNANYTPLAQSSLSYPHSTLSPLRTKSSRSQTPRTLFWYTRYFYQLSVQDRVPLQLWFDSKDVDKTGFIDDKSLSSLQFWNTPIGLDLARRFISIFDKTRRNAIDFQEFATLHQFLITMQSAFFNADRTRTGYANLNELLPSLQIAGFFISLSTTENILSRFDITNKGVLLWDEFLQVIAYLAIVRSVFDWLDEDNDGKIELDYDKFANYTLYLKQ